MSTPMINVYGVSCSPYGSEYGDLYIVYAESEEEAIKLTTEYINSKQNITFYSTTYYGIAADLDGEYFEKGVADSHTT